jgi:DNA-binding transcriptional MerR regulator/mannose-6-phosphate isomerase-like protein (cupin superfamily)
MTAMRPAATAVPAAPDPSTAVPDRSGPLVGALGIEAAARTVGVSPSALRLWERQGLVRPERTPGGLRRYRPEDVARLRAIRHWRAVDGLNAAAIRRLLDDGGAVGAGRTSGGRTAHTGPRSGGAPATLTGPRLRAAREREGMTLRQASSRSGLSVSFISGLERGVTGASIAALQRLTSAYGATLGGLLEEPTVGRVVRPSERRVLDTGAGVRIEHLASATLSLEPQLFVLQAGSSSDGAYSHPGEEFMFVLDGEMTVWLGETEVYRLEAGDALTFPSTVPHRFQAHGDIPTRLIWVNTPPTF